MSRHIPFVVAAAGGSLVGLAGAMFAAMSVVDSVGFMLASGLALLGMAWVVRGSEMSRFGSEGSASWRFQHLAPVVGGLLGVGIGGLLVFEDVQPYTELLAWLFVVAAIAIVVVVSRLLAKRPFRNGSGER